MSLFKVNIAVTLVQFVMSTGNVWLELYCISNNKTPQTIIISCFRVTKDEPEDEKP